MHSYAAWRHAHRTRWKPPSPQAWQRSPPKTPVAGSPTAAIPHNLIYPEKRCNLERRLRRLHVLPSLQSNIPFHKNQRPPPEKWPAQRLSPTFPREGGQAYPERIPGAHRTLPRLGINFTEQGSAVSRGAGDRRVDLQQFAGDINVPRLVKLRPGVSRDGRLTIIRAVVTAHDQGKVRTGRSHRGDVIRGSFRRCRRRGLLRFRTARDDGLRSHGVRRGRNRRNRKCAGGETEQCKCFFHNFEVSMCFYLIALHLGR